MLGGPKSRSGRVPTVCSSPGFDPRTVHLVASRCTDRAIPAQVADSFVKISVNFSNIYGSVSGNAVLGWRRWEASFRTGTRTCQVVASGNSARVLMAHWRVLIVCFN
jgi:hypothetical protein